MRIQAYIAIHHSIAFFMANHRHVYNYHFINGTVCHVTT